MAFSGEVADAESGPDDFAEVNMNPGLNGRDLRDAFATQQYAILLVANKFQTGFDQPCSAPCTSTGSWEASRRSRRCPG